MQDVRLRTDEPDQLIRLERRLDRERHARKEAESLLEQKSYALYSANQQLSQLASELEQRVDDRTRELVKAREHALELAERDQLTGHANRARFARALSEVADLACRDGTRVTLLLIDLDRFKDINDTLGHEAGDMLLCHAARQLRDAAQDSYVVARLGGDEFAAICVDTKSGAAAGDIAARIIDKLKVPTNYAGRPLVTSCSIGIAVFPDDAQVIGDLQRYADIALYRSKAKGRGSATRFNPGMSAEIESRQQLERELRSALIAADIDAWYQPIVDARSRLECGHEVLARWPHATRGILEPAAFISLAEDCGLIDQLFSIVLIKACHTARPWISRGRIRYLSVNVSPSQFRSGHLVDDVLGILALTRFPAAALVLEITEEVLLFDTVSARNQLIALAEKGVRVAIDDFGIGYSNMASLRDLPIQILKLDRSLTANVVSDAKSRAIVKAVADIARALGIDLVAEGVETEAQAKWLTRSNCPQLQGYLFGRAQPSTSLQNTIDAVRRKTRVVKQPHRAQGRRRAR